MDNVYACVIRLVLVLRWISPAVWMNNMDRLDISEGSAEDIPTIWNVDILLPPYQSRSWSKAYDIYILKLLYTSPLRGVHYSKSYKVPYSRLVPQNTMWLSKSPKEAGCN